MIGKKCKTFLVSVLLVTGFNIVAEEVDSAAASQELQKKMMSIMSKLNENMNKPADEYLNEAIELIEKNDHLEAVTGEPSVAQFLIFLPLTDDGNKKLLKFADGVVANSDYPTTYHQTAGFIRAYVIARTEGMDKAEEALDIALSVNPNSPWSGQKEKILRSIEERTALIKRFKAGWDK